MPAFASVASVCDFVLTVVAICAGSDMARILSPPGQSELRWRLTRLDEGPDVACAAGVEEHVALPDRGLLGQQPRVEQRLARVLGERALVAREAARQVGEVRV